MLFQEPPPILGRSVPISDQMGRHLEQPHAHGTWRALYSISDESHERLLSHVLRDVAVTRKPMTVPVKGRKNVAEESVEVQEPHGGRGKSGTSGKPPPGGAGCTSDLRAGRPQSKNERGARCVTRLPDDPTARVRRDHLGGQQQAVGASRPPAGTAHALAKSDGHPGGRSAIT